MKSLRLLHITDLHCEKKKGRYHNTADIKDKNISKKTSKKINSLWVHEFLSTIDNWQKENQNLDAILCTGDLGNAGNADEIELGVKFIENLCLSINVNKDKVILCPGNHDLDRCQQGKEFEKYESISKKYGFLNYSSYENSKTVRIDDIPIISLNSCMGGSEKSVFIEKYKQIIDEYSKTKKAELLKLKKELESLNQTYLLDYLDIPFVGVKQIQQMEDSIKKTDDCAIIIMHHNPVPQSSKEVRPYSTVVDGGVVIDKLMKKKKKIFLFHGHTHFNYNILSYYPHNRDRNSFIATIGCGALNDSGHSFANIYEFYFTDDNKHLITNIFSISQDSSSGFEERMSCKIYEDDFSVDELKILLYIQEHLIQSNSITFSYLKTAINDELTKDGKKNIEDNAILKVILQNEWKLFGIEKAGCYNDWIIRNKN